MRIRLPALLSVLLLTSFSARAQDAPKGPANLAEALAAAAAPLVLKDGKLQGAGAEAILQAAGETQFVLIGEDHGFAEPPEFAAALQRSLGAKRFDHFVTETGYHSVRELESIMRSDKGWPAVVDLCKRHPHALAFLFHEEDMRLAESFVRLGPGPRIWGIDQEMLMAPALNLELLERLAAKRDAATREKLATMAAKLRQRVAEIIAAKKYGSPMESLTEADFTALRALFPDKGEAREIVDDLALSAEIYKLNEISSYRSNRLRSRLMKRYFLQHYRAAEAKNPKPRALFKMGAFHAGRGRSGTNQFDIGNLVSELAEGNGGESVHLLVISPGGEKNGWYPWSADLADRKKPYQGEKLDDVIGVKPFFTAAAGRTDWTVFDLRPLRLRRVLRTGASPLTESLIFQYDFVVVTQNARAAKIIE